MESSRKNDEVNYPHYKVICCFNKTLPDYQWSNGPVRASHLPTSPKTSDFVRMKTLSVGSKSELAEEITVPTQTFSVATIWIRHSIAASLLIGILGLNHQFLMSYFF